tara:strand:+ start:18 stop:776 length:759 start_codon:yes stop_codon:yes gene_type:complete
MGIFRNFTKALKQAAPVIGAGIGMYFGGPMGASIGSGIGSLASGRSTEEALMNAALAGGTTYAMGGKDFGKGFNFSTADSPLRGLFGSTSVSGGDPTGNTFGTSIKSVADGGSGSGIMDVLKDNKYLIGGGLGLAALGAGGDEKKEIFKDPYAGMPDSRVRLGTGMVGDKRFNLNDEAERKAYYTANQNRGLFAVGGEVTGPGTGTSDSVPARLSDGEFVVTADAVRGAGGGDRNVGAARMYDMMSQLEGAA